MAMDRIRGTIIHSASSRASSSMVMPTASGVLRRYLKKKTTIATVTAAAKNTQIPLMKSISASTCGAKLDARSEEHTSELQSRSDLVCRLLLEKKKKKMKT